MLGIRPDIKFSIHHKMHAKTVLSVGLDQISDLKVSGRISNYLGKLLSEENQDSLYTHTILLVRLDRIYGLTNIRYTTGYQTVGDITAGGKPELSIHTNHVISMVRPYIRP